jgi:hypothetical protein
MALKEVDAISDAIIETEREIAGDAWGMEETERDESGRSLEEMGEGLEGQHEAEDDDELEDDESEGDEEPEGEDDGESEGDKKPEAKPDAGNEVEQPKPLAAEQPVGRVPAGKHREALERARVAEAERDTIRVENEKRAKALEDKLELALRQIDDLRRTPRAEARPVEPPKPETIPDIFEDPKGFAEHLTRGFQTELSKRDTQLANQRVETSMAIAHAFHKDAFENAFAAINKLNPQNPDDRVTVQRIYSSPNPGEALVGWHKRNETLARVGDDPAKFEDRIRSETREALMKDPEFRKQLLAGLREDASRGDDGNPRTITRLPKSLHRATGSNVGADRGDRNEHDDSDSAVADAAWR